MAGRTLKVLAAAAVILALLVVVAILRDLGDHRGRTTEDQAAARPTPRPPRVAQPSRRPASPPASPSGTGTPPLVAPTPTGSSSPEPKHEPANPRPLPFAPGERLDYTVSWAGMQAGRLTLRLAAGPAPGTLRLRCEGATEGLVSAAFDAGITSVVTCADDTLLPLELHRETRERDQVRSNDARYRHDVGLVETGGQQFPLVAGAWDPLTALYALRTLEFGAVGSIQNLAVNDLGRPFAVRARVIGRDDGQVRVELAAAAAGAAAEFTATVLLEADGRRRILALTTVTPGGAILVTLDESGL